MTPPKVTAAAVVAVGNELLYGQTVDGNSAWLGRHLAERGIPVVRGFTVGDVAQDIREALERATSAADIVFVSGGLGPTPDDLTKEAVADFLGLEIVEDEGARRDVEARFRAAGLDHVPPRSVSQYEVPRGATVLANPAGTAPGLLLETEEVRVILLPGVPGELRAIVEGSLRDRLTEWAGGEASSVVHHRVVHTAGIFETKLAEALEPALDALPHAATDGIDLAYLPDLLGVDLRFTVRGVEREAAERRFETLLHALDGVLGPWRFEAESGDLAEAVVRALREGAWTLAVAESCTGGLLGKRITDVPGASRVFLGGVIAYSNDAKVAQVDVDPGAIRDHGAVSEDVATALAQGVARRFGARVGVGITGVAGPGGGTPEKPVGTVWIGVSVDGSADARRHNFPGNREQVRVRAAQAALVELHRRLRGPGGGRTPGGASAGAGG